VIVRIKDKILTNNYGMEYKVYVDAPKNLKPTKEDVGKLAEVAGKQRKDGYFRIMEVDEGNNILVTTRDSLFKTFPYDSVILHRDEEVRAQKGTIIEFMKSGRKKRTRGARK